MAKQDTRSNIPKITKDDSWGSVFEFLETHWKRFSWLVTIAVGIFTGGYYVGSFYQRLMNKFEISELKTNFNKEIRDLKDENIRNEIQRIKETTSDFIKSTVNNPDSSIRQRGN